MRKLFSFVPLLALAAAAVFFMHSGHALAFTANNLIDDGVFNNTNTMNAAAIDNWLNSNFPSSCISTNNGFSAPDVIGYSPNGPVATGGFSYGSDVSAGTIIYHAAQVYGLNPQVILTTLEKEESLVSGSGTQSNPGCSNLRYTAAMGYLCTDSVSPHDYSGFELYSLHGTPVTSVTGTCTESEHVAGFSRQVIVAAWQLRFDEQRSEGNVGWNVQLTNYPNAGNTWDNSDDPQTCYSHKMTQGFYQVCPGGPSATFDGLYSIDGTTVHMDNGATAALYNYTPHFGGNQNFDSIFQNWFGTTFDVYTWSLTNQYAYTDQNKTTSVDLSNLIGGQKVYVGFTARNTGDTTWTNSGNNPIDAGTASPQDRNSAFCDTSDSPAWIDCARPARMAEASVAPGATGTFDFWYKAPLQSGTYNERFNLVAENIKWMNDIGLYFHTVVKPPTYTWSLTNQYAYTDQTKTTPVNLGSLTPGQRVYIGFQARNTGNVTWSNTGSNPIRVGTSGPRDRSSRFCDNSWLGCSRPAAMSESSVAPGATGTFDFWYKAPASTGTYGEAFSLVAEGITWMNDPGMNFYTVVGFDTSGGNVLASGGSLTTGQSITSTDGRFRLIMQGDGNLVLYSLNRALWSSGTAGAPATWAVIQGDGNLVLYSAQNKPYWSSGTAGRGTSTLVTQSDGNLVIYSSSGQPTWDSHTNGKF